MITNKIINWYYQNRRELPWRASKDPYRIWLSEIILQQTRVAQGVPYYQRFIEKYPAVTNLAQAPEEEVLRLWQGLGYYSRARNLHATAKIINTEYEGQFPTTYDQIIKLKGIGPYTAAAISSIAFDESQAVVDGNVYRVISRLFNESIPINEPKGIKLFREIAHSLLPVSNCGDYNQAIMELGALVCKPQNPTCLLCPVQVECAAFKANTVSDLPVKLKKVKVKQRFFHYFFHTVDSKTLFKKRDTSDIWGNMYDFPLLVLEKGEKPSFSAVLEYDLEVKHKLTHQHINATFWKTKGELPAELMENAQFFSNEHIEDLPKPKLIVNYLSKKT